MSVEFFVDEYPKIVDSFHTGTEKELTAVCFTFGNVDLSIAVGRISGSIPCVPGELFPERNHFEFSVVDRETNLFITDKFCNECMTDGAFRYDEGGGFDVSYIASDRVIALLHKVKMWSDKRA